MIDSFQSGAPQNGASSFPGANHGVSQNATNEGIDAKYYWHILLERRWLVIASFIAVLASGLIYLQKTTRIYEAVAQLQIDTEDPDVLKGTLQYITDAKRSHLLNTEHAKLMSRTLIQKVVDILDLKNDPLYKEQVDVVQALSENINVTPKRMTHLVLLGVEHTDPNQAELIANTLTDEFIKLNKENKVGKLADRHSYLEEEVQSTKEKLNVARQRMQDYRESQGKVSLEKDQDIALQALVQAQADYAKAEGNEAVARSIAEKMQAQLAAGKPLSAIPQIAADPQVSLLKQSLATYEAELQGLLVRYLEGWPRVKELRERIASLKLSLVEAAEDALQSAILLAEQSQAKLEKLTELVQEREKAHLALNEQRIQYDIESRNADQLRSLYNLLLVRLEEVRIAQRSHVSSITVVDRAVAPFEPVKPHIPLTLLISVFGGLVLGVGLAFFVNFLDDSVKTQEDVEGSLGLTFLGYIAKIKSKEISERGREAYFNPQSVASESFRTLRATISLLPSGGNYRAIAVSSTKSGEGKSLATSNLAIVCAQSGNKTLLVDADLRRPTLHEIYQLPNTRGLSDCLVGSKSLDEIVQREGDIENLHYVTSGAIPNNPSELLSSDRFSKLIEDARQRYDRIVIDCPPISAVSDPLSIASRCDGLVFISRFNKVRREHARRTIQRLKEAGVQTIGGLINNISAENVHSYYYYYSDYYYKPYKSGSSKQKDDAAKKEPEPEIKARA